jgi:arylsulfatase A-like enzyme
VAGALSSILLGAPAPHPSLLLVSIDGLHPRYLLEADRLGLKIPNLRALLKQGAHARSVRGVMPTVTYPSHTTLVTGVSPARHAIPANVVFDPERRNLDGWYWYSEDIHAPTLWEAAANAGYKIGSVNWPVTVGAPSIQYNIPEFWRAKTAEDQKLMRVVSSPGLMAALEPAAGLYSVLADAEADRARTRYALALITQKHVGFVAIHLAAVDHEQHESTPFTAPVFAALEANDEMLGQLIAAMRRLDPRAVVAVVADHGLARVHRQLNLNVAFAQAGLLTVTGARVTAWQAAPWPNGGSAPVIVRHPAARERTHQLLLRLAANPENGIARVLDRPAIAALGGTPLADFWVDMQPGYAVGSAVTGPLVESTGPRGVHGYAPDRDEMRCSFVIAGPGIQPGLDLGDIDLRHIAPTLSGVLGIPFPGAELPALPLSSAR